MWEKPDDDYLNIIVQRKWTTTNKKKKLKTSNQCQTDSNYGVQLAPHITSNLPTAWQINTGWVLLAERI